MVASLPAAVQNSDMVVGLTGGIACGKSTGAALFVENGFRSIDCDDLVRDLLTADREIVEAVGRRFGDSVVTPGGAVDRGVLGERVFADPEELDWLEGLLHPRVNETWLAEVGSGPGANWVVQIPLLFEKGLEKEVDSSVCVAASVAVQLRRLSARGIAERQARQRMARQWPIESKMERADYVLLNEGAPAFLRAQVLFFLERDI